MVAILLALATSGLWGISDFLGGNAARTVAPVVIALIAEAIGLVATTILWAFLGTGLDAPAFLFALGSGVTGAVGLILLYGAFARGLLSIVAPIVALSAIIPVAAAIVGGERPALIALIGAMVALAGAVIAARGETAHEHADVDATNAVAWALGAAGAFGVGLYLLGRSGKYNDAIASLVGVRIAAVPLLLVICAITRPSLSGIHANRAALVAVGVTDIGANGCFVLASGRGLQSLVSVLSSLYPVVVIGLAHIVLGERITRSQYLGVGATLAGVAMVSVGGA